MMASDPLKVLDQVRQRLSQLSTSIQTLHAELERAQPLPTWPSLQSSAQLLAYNLQQISDVLAANRTILRAAHAYPLPTFPGHTHPFILETLLSKKLAPRAEEWIDQFGKDDPAKDETTTAKNSEMLSDKELADLWNWAGPAESQIVRQMLEDGDFEDDYTMAERDAGTATVVTGLRRNLDGENTDTESDGEDESKDGVTSKAEQDSAAVSMGIDPSRPALPLENVLRFMTTGDVQSHVAQQRR